MKIENALVILDRDGKNLVVIPKIIFHGKRSISWNKVENYLLQYTGKIFEVSETEDFIHIDNKFSDEFTGSKYTKNLRGALSKVKANLVQGIPQMIEIAVKKRWSKDFGQKHGKKAAKGWYRYDTRFALPVINEEGKIICYNIYQAVLIVRYAANNKLYLYDIQNIKKETSYPSWTILSDGQKPIS